MIKERKLAIPYSTVFISQLSEETRYIIREDLRRYADENGERLAWDQETRDYSGMSRRFCDMDGIYQDTKLMFCKEGEDAEAYFHAHGNRPVKEQTR